MKFFLLRLSPWLIAGFAIVMSWWQWQQPLIYPWPLVLVVASAVAAAFLMGWKKLSWRGGLEKMLPGLLTLAVVGFGFLLAEGWLMRLVTSVVLALIPLVALELLFLLIHDQTRYPVNGLSRFNIALVPVAGFFLGSTLNGISVFLQLSLWIGIVSFMILGASLYVLTVHPTAPVTHKRRWIFLGGLVGGQIGVLGALLPIGMAPHGALAAFLLCIPLRLRRYAYSPCPSNRVAWSEAALVVVAFVALLLTARWA